VRAQQVSQLQNVGRPVLLPLEWAKFIGRRADPISDGGGRRCLEQTGFQARLPRGGLTAILSTLFRVLFLPRSGLTAILSALVRC
jgi:hypothetical protein